MTIDPGNARRLPGEAVTGITGLRLHPPGSEAGLVNISATGVLASSPTKLRVGFVLRVQFEGGFSPQFVDGRVVRCEVAMMERDGLLRYHIAIEFDTPIVLEQATAVPTAAATPAPAAAPKVRNRW